jgi:hypothetical protein
MTRPALSPRDRRALRAGLLLLAPALAYALLVRPYLGALGAARERLADERALLVRERALVREASSFPDRRRRAATALGATWTRIVRGGDTVSVAAALAGYVSMAAEGAGLLVEQVESRGADSARSARLGAGGLVASSVELRARGDLERVLRFLAALESGETYVRIDGLRVAKVSGAGDAADQETLTVTANVTGIARVLARPAAVYAAPPPARPREPAVAALRSAR